MTKPSTNAFQASAPEVNDYCLEMEDEIERLKLKISDLVGEMNRQGDDLVFAMKGLVEYEIEIMRLKKDNKNVRASFASFCTGKNLLPEDDDEG